MVMDRIDGKPVQQIQATIDDRTDIEQFSDAELTLLMQNRISELATIAKTKPPAIDKDGNTID
jgi:hypothetical protein